jgi:hypothetical protein
MADSWKSRYLWLDDCLLVAYAEDPTTISTAKPGGEQFAWVDCGMLPPLCACMVERGGRLSFGMPPIDPRPPTTVKPTDICPTRVHRPCGSWEQGAGGTGRGRARVLHAR